MPDLPHLSDAEQLAFAGLVRALVRLEGGFSEAEREVVEDVGRRLLGARAATGDTPYRSADGADELAPAEQLWELLERAGDLDDEAVRAAAARVERQEAREAIYEALFSIAASDAISPGEGDLLEWLQGLWRIDVTTDPGGEPAA